jgi:hypothetical protein
VDTYENYEFFAMDYQLCGRIYLTFLYLQAMSLFCFRFTIAIGGIHLPFGVLVV